MLIIDEADRIKLELLPEVRDISDKLDISVVLVGTSTRIIAVLKRDEQIANRFRAHRTFGQLKGNDFTRTVAIWESKVLKLPLPSNLTSKSNISILSDASDGYIGRLDELLREAAIKSLVKGHKRIEKDVLEEVAKEYSWP